MLGAAADLDLLDTLSEDDGLTVRQLLQSKREARQQLAQARRQCQRLVDDATQTSDETRHRVTYGRIAAQNMGLVDLSLLSDDLRTQVLDHLQTEHGIDPQEYTPQVEQM